MKQIRILMLTQYFYLSDRGGSEQSAYHLAKNLKKRDHQIFIFRGRGLIQLFNFIHRHRPNLIHVHSPCFLLAAVIITKLYRLPIIFTARDYSLICPLGFCLWKRSIGCSLAEFLTQDIPTYTRLYPSNILSPLLHLGVRLQSNLWRFLAHQVDQIVCISRAQKHIFAANGFHHLQVIYNTTEFLSHPNYPRGNQIIFVGRLTPGKGADLLVPLVNQLPSRYQLLIVGSGFLEAKIRRQIQQFSLHHRVFLTGQIDYQSVIKLYNQAKLAVFPSRWPEPFGRGALEALASGIPVVTSNRGGLPEIAQNKYGLSVEPTPTKLAQAIDYVIKHHRQFTTAIRRDRAKLISQFHTQPVDQYEAIYRRYLS